MDPGKMDQRVAIEREDRSPDGAGGSTVIWVQIAEVWASVWPVGATEQLRAEQQVGTALYRVRIRRGPEVTPAHRLRWVTNGNQAMNIRGVLDAGQRQAQIEIMAETGVAV